VTALFDTRAEAQTAVEELVRTGIPPTDVRITPENDVAASGIAATGAPHTSYDRSKDEKGFWAALADFFMPDEDRYTYAEAMNRGSIMVSVTVDDAREADEAEEILEKHGTVNIAEREETWRKSGWSGYTSGASGASSSARDVKMKTGEQVLPEVEERLRVGKRQVSSGRVKVRSYVVEKPVSEQVNLRSETVSVERRPADRGIAAGDDAFRERTIEAVATSEEAVVAKDVRVTGEVVVKKQATDRKETVTDKVRSTKVEVDDTGTSGNKPRRP